MRLPPYIKTRGCQYMRGGVGAQESRSPAVLLTLLVQTSASLRAQ